MAVVTDERPTLTLLAKQIEREIRTRGLREGDRFMTTEQVGQMLGVSNATAHRAMNHLVEHSLLVRHHGRGTFVGRIAGESRPLQLHTVHILLPEDQRQFASLELDVLVEAVRAHVGRVNVQVSFLRGEDAASVARELVEHGHEARGLVGVIPISCPREVYRVLSEASVSTVVFGSIYGDQRRMPSVDVDHHQAGQLMTEHLLRKGHQRLALLATGGGRPGDDAFYDGVSAALTRAALPHNALIVRTFPQDFAAFRAQIEGLFASLDRPTGIICRSERFVRVVATTGAVVGLAAPRDLDIVFQTQSSRSLTKPSFAKYAHVRPRESFKQIAQELAIMLKRVAEGRSLAPERVVIPVELHAPDEYANGG
jgi:DNA-binding LacI/PurR family transcriptional regulator